MIKLLHRILIASILGSVLCTQVAWAGYLSPGLAFRVQSLSGEEMLQVVVVLKDQVAVPSHGSSCSEKVTQMEQFCAATQHDLAQYLEKQKFFGRVGSYNAFWLVNAIAVEATRLVIENIARRSDVLEVRLPQIFHLPQEPPVSEGSSPQSILLSHGGTIEPNLSLIRASDVWNLKDGAGNAILGRGVRVGVADSGVKSDHPDLVGKIERLARADAQGIVTVGAAPDPDGHGTHVCSIIAGGNASGASIGVAPEAKLTVIRVFDQDGTKLNASDAQILGGVEWLVKEEVDVVNMSFGSDTPNEANTLFFSGNNQFGGVEKWVSKLGGVLVAAIGNFGKQGSETTTSPGNIPKVIGVGATGKTTTEEADFSSRGPIDWTGKIENGGVVVKPDISAPGQAIFGAGASGSYEHRNGTSQAAPHVTGVIALLMQADPTLTFSRAPKVLERFDRVKNTLYAKTQRQPPAQNNVSGWGLVDALAAVNAVLGPDRDPPSVSISSVNKATFGEPFVVTSTAVDSRVANVTMRLRHRRTSQNAFQTIEMSKVDTFTYRAVIPGSEMVENVQYYVEASDGTNTTFSPAGGASLPTSVSVEPTDTLTLASLVSGPSPFSPARDSTISFTFRPSRSENVQVYIYDITGTVLKVIPVSATFQAGSPNVVDWNGITDFGDSVRDGAYLYQVVANNHPLPTGRGKFLVLR